MENKKIHQQFSNSFLCLEEEMKLQTEEIKEEKNADTEIGILEEFLLFLLSKVWAFKISRFWTKRFGVSQYKTASNNGRTYFHLKTLGEYKARTTNKLWSTEAKLEITSLRGQRL